MLALVSCTLERCTGSGRRCCCSCGAHQSRGMYLDMQQELMIGDAQNVSSSTDPFLQPDSLTSSLQSARIILPAPHQTCSAASMAVSPQARWQCQGLVVPEQENHYSMSHCCVPCCTVQGVDLHLTDMCPSLTKVKEQRIKRLGCSQDDVSCIMQALSPVPLSLSATSQP